MSLRWRPWAQVAATLALVATVVIGVPAIHQPMLRVPGWALVVSDRVTTADVIVIAVNAGGAGVLEAADLVQAGVSTQVAIFSDPPSDEDHEFVRRGLPYEDEAARQTRQLMMLGVRNVMRIPRTDAGTQGEGQALPHWCDEHQFRSIVVVATADHSRRLRRVLDRAMSGHPTSFAIRPSRYSSFDPDRWWKTRRGIRIGIVELQKLTLDVVLHPISF